MRGKKVYRGSEKMDGILIRDTGSFHIGGKVVRREDVNPSAAGGVLPQGLRGDTGGYFAEGQMYVQYIRQMQPKCRYPLMFWHGGGLTGACWETTPDGREGWQMYFLRQGYDVYVSDAVERGRASWASCDEMYPKQPVFVHLEHVWKSFRFGPKFDIDPAKCETWPGLQFPLESLRQFLLQNVPRWTGTANMILAAYVEYLKKMEKSIIVGHSQGCYMAIHAALAAPENVRAMVFAEPSALWLPDFDKVDVSVLKDIPQVMIFGDYVEKSQQWTDYRKKLRDYQERVVKAGGKVDWIDLPDLGIHGNSHMLIMDKNNLEIAAIAQKWLKEQGLFA